MSVADKVVAFLSENHLRLKYIDHDDDIDGCRYMMISTTDVLDNTKLEKEWGLHVNEVYAVYSDDDDVTEKVWKDVVSLSKDKAKVVALQF